MRPKLLCRNQEILHAMGSVLTNKYAEGYPGKRYYSGCTIVDEVERIAQDRCKTLFNAQHANVQPHAVHKPIWLSILLV